MTTAIVVTGGLFIVYLLAISMRSVADKTYYSNTGVVKRYNDLFDSGPRTINKCGGCGYLFSNYFLHENDRVTCGCPRCGVDQWLRVGAYPVLTGTAHRFDERAEWREVKK